MIVLPYVEIVEKKLVVFDYNGNDFDYNSITVTLFNPSSLNFADVTRSLGYIFVSVLVRSLSTLFILSSRLRFCTDHFFLVFVNSLAFRMLTRIVCDIG